MIVLLPLVRKLPIPVRRVVGLALTVAGLAAVIAALVAVRGLFLEGAITLVVGLVFVYSAWTGARRAAVHVAVGGR